jgi:hypothetical protein
MDIPIEYSGFEGRGLSLRTAGLFSGPKILIDNQLVMKQQGQYVVRDNRGEQVVIRIKNRLLDPIPNLYIGGNLVELARPLKGHEYEGFRLKEEEG